MADLPHYKLFIDGVWCEGAAGEVQESLNP